VKRDLDPLCRYRTNSKHNQDTDRTPNEEGSRPKREHGSKQDCESDDTDREEWRPFSGIGSVDIGPRSPADLADHEHGNRQKHYQSDEEHSPECFVWGAEVQGDSHDHDYGHREWMTGDRYPSSDDVHAEFRGLLGDATHLAMCGRI